MYKAYWFSLNGQMIPRSLASVHSLGYRTPWMALQSFADILFPESSYISPLTPICSLPTQRMMSIQQSLPFRYSFSLYVGIPKAQRVGLWPIEPHIGEITLSLHFSGVSQFPRFIIANLGCNIHFICIATLYSYIRLSKIFILQLVDTWCIYHIPFLLQISLP